MPRKKKAAAAAVAPVVAAPPAVESKAPEAPKAEKPGAVSVTSRYHEPYKADAWFVGYSLKSHAEPLEDGAFRDEESANAHADRIREAYGLR
jgi:hypothetical protein